MKSTTIGLAPPACQHRRGFSAAVAAMLMTFTGCLPGAIIATYLTPPLNAGGLQPTGESLVPIDLDLDQRPELWMLASTNGVDLLVRPGNRMLIWGSPPPNLGGMTANVSEGHLILGLAGPPPLRWYEGFPATLVSELYGLPGVMNAVYFGSCSGGCLTQFLNTSGYYGVEFTLDDGLHYGWVHVDAATGLGIGGLIDRWAYESVPGAGIRAGAVPEPGMAALLGAGACFFLRRKRCRSGRGGGPPTIAALALLASAGSLPAAIIVTHHNPPLNASQYQPDRAQPFSVDLNQDNHPEFWMGGGISDLYVRSGNRILTRVLPPGGATVTANLPEGHLLLGVNVPPSFDWYSGVPAPETSAYFEFPGVMNAVYFAGFGSLSSYFYNTSGYIGVEFSLHDGLHYGWVHVNHLDADGNPLGDGGLIDRWAYESEPGAGIRAGAVPEPRAAALLAGLAGLAVLRRRR